MSARPKTPPIAVDVAAWIASSSTDDVAYIFGAAGGDLARRFDLTPDEFLAKARENHALDEATDDEYAAWIADRT